MSDVIDIIEIEKMIQSAVARAKERETVTNFLETTDTPSLEKLAYTLRHPETWPEDFTWDFTKCSHCAVGLAHRLWNDMMSDISVWHAGVAFKLSDKDAHKIFSNPPMGCVLLPPKWVSPEMVARRIERYLKSRT